MRGPDTACRDGAIAQLGERLNGIQEVGGSTPPGSTKRVGRRARWANRSGQHCRWAMNRSSEVKSLINAVVANIRAARVVNQPFYHLELDRVFPDDVYAKM